MSTSIADQIAAVRAELATRPAGLIAHVQRVLVEALDLAQRWDADPERVELATWGHDLFRSFPPEDQLRLARETGVPITYADEASPVLLHGPIAAAVLRERFGVRDEEALAAVRQHTVGGPSQPIIAKIILLADKFEERKRNKRPVMKAIRRAARTDLDLALLCWSDWMWVDESEHDWTMHPQHWLARTAWVAEHHLGRRTRKGAGRGGSRRPGPMNES